MLCGLCKSAENCSTGCHAQDPEAVVAMLQVQTELGPGHINLINVYELILSDDYLGLVMEYAQGGSLTAHVAERWGTATAGKLVMDEDEARYFFRVSSQPCSMCSTAGLEHMSKHHCAAWLVLHLGRLFLFL